MEERPHVVNHACKRPVCLFCQVLPFKRKIRRAPAHRLS
jgi:hypothetical protein